MHSYKTKGIIIGRRNFSEADRLITIMTADRGKQIFLARGVRKITSQRGPRVEMFNYIRGQVYHGKTWDILGEVDTLNRFTHLRQNLFKVATAYEVCELVDRLVPENDSQQAILDLILAQLEALDQNQLVNLDNLLFNFKTKLLILTGFWPKDRLMENGEANHFIEKLIHAKIKSKSLRASL